MPAHVDGMTSLRGVALSMTETGLNAVLVDNSVGPVGLVTAMDVVGALARGGDPDRLWAGDLMRAAPETVTDKRNPVEVGEQMAAYELDVVAVLNDSAPVGVASALDVLCEILPLLRDRP